MASIGRQIIMQSNNKENIKAPRYCPLYGESISAPALIKDQVMTKMFQYRDIS